MTNALPVNGFMNPTSIQPALAEQTTGGGVVRLDKSKEWQMELVMEKIRSKASSFKSLVEMAKNVRMAMLDKRFGIDSVEKNQLQKCLDTLQHSIKVTSLQSMIERLESLSRQLGLKFMIPGPPSGPCTEIFISSDMFYLEILLEPSGAVRDVKIHHEGKNEQQSCEELVACLSRGDFVDFTTQLEGLASIYQLNADKKVKCKAFSALQSLETDLGILAQLQTIMKEPFNIIHKSPVGILERRKGGHAMKLTYFVSPYDLIDQENKTCDPLSLEAVISKKVGHSVTVCMEGSTAHRLPTSSIITVNRGSTGKSTPSYAPLTSANSSMLPACFVLKLAKKMPMCLELIRRIQKVTDLECTDISPTHPLLSLIVRHASDKQLDCQHNRGLPVNLPDQQHCYFMTENRNMDGVLVGSIPFTHPGHVPQILVFLRQQALFNTLISSCIRPMARQDPEHATIFEVSALSWQCISISLEHPFEETLATAELDLSDISALKCKLYGVSINNIEQTSDLAGKVLQRCLSIPLTMRTMIKTWETFMLNPQIGGGNGNKDIKIKEEPGAMNGTDIPGRQQQQQQQHQQPQQQPQQPNQQQQQSFLEAGAENSIGFPSFSGNSSADTTPTITFNPSLTLSTSATALSESKSKKARKRKTDGSWTKSPKRKNDPNEIILESSSSDSTPLGTPTSVRDGVNEVRTPTPTSAASFTSGGIDLSNPDPLEVMSAKSSDYDIDIDPDILQVDPVINVEEALKRERKLKKRSEEKTSPTSFFDESKGLVSPSVSITPISSSTQNTNYNSMLTSMGLERRPGIEIIPITSLSQTQIPSSITITAISNPPKSSSSSSGDDRKERKSSSSKNRSSSSNSEDSKIKLEKKRKRKRDSSPMGPPPDKLPPKQDPLSKPVSVSIKPTSESPPSALSSSRPSSPATTLRKFSPSPTRGNPLVVVGKVSPTLKQSSSSSVGKPIQSPKHSPVYSSPKHVASMPSNMSPKHGTSSPKHGNSGSAGKPSMSALKSATSSPSSKADGSGVSSKKISSPSSSVTLSTISPSSLSKESKDKERKAAAAALFGSSGSNSPKSKSSVSKSKPIDADSQSSVSGGSGSSTPPTDPKITAAQQASRNRKGSLSAIVDKLKNAQHVSDDGISPGSNLTPTGGATITPVSKNLSGDVKNPAEYMVKPSSDGIKLTINKTRMKDLKSNNNNLKLTSMALSGSSIGAGSITPSTSSSGNGSPKTYTGLKPGVSSGPASRKPQVQTSPKIRSASPLTSSSGIGRTGLMSGQKAMAMKSASGSNLLSSSGGLTGKGISSKSFSSSGGSMKHGSMATDFSRSKEKTRFKSGDKSFTGKASDLRKQSSSMESENEKAFKLLAAHASMGGLSNLPGLVGEGLIKQLNTNFQIPKISARVNADSGDKRSVDKVDSSSKSSGEQSSRAQILSNPTASTSISRMEETHAVGRSSSVAVDYTTSSSSSTTNESDVPTNLSMQPDANSGVESSSKDSVNSSKQNPYSVGGDGSSTMETLNLVTKGSEKYKSSDEKEQQHQALHRLPQSDKKLLDSSATASVTLTPVASSVSSTSTSAGSQQAGEALLDFSASKDSGVSSSSSSSSTAASISVKSSLAFASSSSSPIRKNTTPPPPPLPPPLPPPPPPSSSISSSSSLPATLPPSVSPISSFPQSPSVSLHIVKSPAPSPRVIPMSPHSASPCITDDELMDEALVGS